MNSFEKSAQIYLGIQGGTTQGKPTTVFTSGILEVDGALGRKVQLGADSSNTAYLDFKSRDGGLADYDSRIISQFGSTGSTAGEGTLSAQASLFQVLCPVRLGSGVAPSFKLDYGVIEPEAVINPQTLFTFAVSFVSAPTVWLQVEITNDNATVGVDVVLSSVTTTGGKTRYIGTPAAGTTIGWLALGL